jgi:hypothetical protein
MRSSVKDLDGLVVIRCGCDTLWLLYGVVVIRCSCGTVRM